MVERTKNNYRMVAIKKSNTRQTVAPDLFAKTGRFHIESASKDMGHADTDRNHYKHRGFDFSGMISETIKEKLEEQLNELQKNPQIQNILSVFGSSISAKVEEMPSAPIDAFLDELLHPQMDEPSTPFDWRDYEGAPPCPWQDNRARERSGHYFHLGAQEQIEFKDSNGLRMYLLRKEIKSKVWEICKLYHALSDRSFPPKIDYRAMKELEKRIDELIEEIIGLLEEEGIIDSRTLSLKASIPAQERPQGECLQSANNASPQGEAVGEATARDTTQGQQKARGPRKHSLREAFIDVKTYEREKQRFINLLNKLKIATRKLTCKAKDYLNQIVTCLMILWRENGFFIEESIPGACVFRFLTEECGLKTKVSEKAYGNRMNEWIKMKAYDIKCYLKVKEAFAQQQ